MNGAELGSDFEKINKLVIEQTGAILQEGDCPFIVEVKGVKG